MTVKVKGIRPWGVRQLSLRPKAKSSSERNAKKSPSPKKMRSPSGNRRSSQRKRGIKLSFRFPLERDFGGELERPTPARSINARPAAQRSGDISIGGTGQARRR